MPAIVTKPRRLQVCPESSPACSYWQHWLDSKGLKWDVLRGMLWRLLDDAEWAEYLLAIRPVVAAA